MDRVFWVIIGMGICLNGLSRAAYADMSSIGVPGQQNMSAYPESENLTSSDVSQTFVYIAESLIAQPSSATTGQALLNTSANSTGQALIFALAARELDNDNPEAIRLIITISRARPETDYAASVGDWLLSDHNHGEDVALFQSALQYVLERMKNRQQKQQLIDTLIDRMRGGHPLVLSRLFTLRAEMALESLNQQEAQDYFAEAYNTNKYNKAAFVQLVESAPDQIPPEMYFEHLRYVMRLNPLDMETALAFAQYAERLELFSLACGGYAYCADLYKYLHPNDLLPAHIYLPWAISCYNNPKGLDEVAQIAEQVRKSGRFDIFLEAIAGRAVLAGGEESLANQIFNAAEQRALQIIQKNTSSETTSTDSDSEPAIGPTQMAWYYSFVRPDKEKSLDWANQAYSQEPNSVGAQSILSYALVMNDQIEWAQPLLDRNTTQIGQVAQAMILLKQNKSNEAIDLLQSAISRDPSSFVTERAKAILQSQGQMYRPQIDTNAVLSSLAGRFHTQIVPTFVPPEQMVSLEFDIRPKNVAYGENINGILSLANQSREPILVGEDGFIQGRVRIDAEVRGVMQRRFVGVVSQPMFSSRLIEPGKAAAASLRLDRGALRSLLLSHPQAVLDIDFTVYVDPNSETAGDRNTEQYRLTLDPVKVSAHRPGAVITTRSLNQQYNAIVYSDVETRIETGRLFTGLLKELAVMDKQGAIYHYRYADWLPDRLRSAFTSDSGLLLFHAYEEWETKTQLLAPMMGLKLDDALSGAVAQHLRNPAWPVRLTALTVLAHSHGTGFSEVLQWTARYDTHALVRTMAQTLDNALRGMNDISPSNRTQGLDRSPVPRPSLDK